jgi:hypothetical protein
MAGEYRSPSIACRRVPAIALPANRGMVKKTKADPIAVRHTAVKNS